MPFDTVDLDPPEIAIVAVEHLRELGRWLVSAAEGAGEGTVVGAEAMHVLHEVGESIQELAAPIEDRVRERFGDRLPDDRGIPPRQAAPRGTVPEDDEDRSLQDLLEVATAELEEDYHFFLFEADRQGEGWLGSLLEEIADELRGVLLFVEEEKETLMEAEG